MLKVNDVVAAVASTFDVFEVNADAKEEAVDENLTSEKFDANVVIVVEDSADPISCEVVKASGFVAVITEDASTFEVVEVNVNVEEVTVDAVVSDMAKAFNVVALDDNSETIIPGKFATGNIAPPNGMSFDMLVADAIVVVVVNSCGSMDSDKFKDKFVAENLAVDATDSNGFKVFGAVEAESVASDKLIIVVDPGDASSCKVLQANGLGVVT